jgi:CDP-glycerol glycerophosphotransferase (TagB/SpsB family)
MLELLRKLGHLVYRFTPKRDIAVIWGWPDHEDSVIALEQALQSSDIETVVILMTNPNDAPPWKLGSKTVWVKKDSLMGWWWFCKSRYVFFTSRCFMREFLSNVVSVNVWHGMPIKRIGWMLEGNEGISSDYALATSPFWAEIMDRSMRPKQPSLDCGLPRNDRLFSDRAEVFKKLEMDPNQRLLAWLPTYRKSVRGEIRNDGIEYGNVFEMPDLDPNALNEYLRANNMILIVKPHPMAVSPSSNSFSHLWIVDNDWLHTRMLSLYEFLGATDAIISDISSVVVDYLLLDRPIIHAFPDIDAYRDSRGFSMEPIADYFMGPVATDADGLFKEIDQVLTGKDPGADKRHSMTKLFHTHVDNQSTERLLKRVL